MKELLNYLLKVCERALNKTHSEEIAIELMQEEINKFNTKGTYPTKQLVKAQSALYDIVDCFDLVIEA